MNPSLYLVPQPGSILRSEAEAIIRDSPRKVFSRKLSMQDYKSLHLGKREYDTPQNEKEPVGIFQKSDSVMQLDANVYIRDASSQGSTFKQQKQRNGRNSSTLAHTIKVNSRTGLNLILDDLKVNTIQARRNSEMQSYLPHLASDRKLPGILKLGSRPIAIASPSTLRALQMRDQQLSPPLARLSPPQSAAQHQHVTFNQKPDGFKSLIKFEAGAQDFLTRIILKEPKDSDRQYASHYERRYSQISQNETNKLSSVEQPMFTDKKGRPTELQPYQQTDVFKDNRRSRLSGHPNLEITLKTPQNDKRKSHI